MNDLWSRLIAALPDHQQRIEKSRLAILARQFDGWRLSDAARADPDDLALARFFGEHIATGLTDLAHCRQLHMEFLRHTHQSQAEAADPAPQLLQYAADLGASARQLAGDRAALSRWFAADALHDRHYRRVADIERQLGLLLQLYGLQCRFSIANGDPDHQWRQLGAEATLAPFIADDGNQHLRFEAFRALAEGLRALPLELNRTALSPATNQYIYRLSLEPRQAVWLQCEALSLLDAISEEDFLHVAEHRLAHPAAGDDLFVRRHCVTLLARQLDRGSAWTTPFEHAATDDKPYVRQAVARLLTTAPVDVAQRCLATLLADSEPTVRGQAILALAELVPTLGRPSCIERLIATLSSDDNAFVLRCALKAAETFATGDGTINIPDDLTSLIDAADHLAVTGEDLRVRRWAAEAVEWLRLHEDADARAWLPGLAQAVAACPAGQARDLPATFDTLPAGLIGRLAQILARRDFGLHFERRRHWRVHRGHRFAFRSWRWLHELRHPSPDKRQAFRHTVGRIFRGSVHAPSAILAELSETKVPGEPLFMVEEGGWRPYLPLPDQILSALDEPRRQRPLFIYSAVGVTEVRVPVSLTSRLRARIALTRHFAEFARLRNWHADSQRSPNDYAQALATLGIELKFSPYPDRRADPSVQRFFALGIVPFPEDLWTRLGNYFFSAYENNLFDLIVFITAALAVFTGRHLHANWQLRRARAAIPLVVGGWGTRGKSGTERLKAALFNSLGYGVVSKTTGCEAMFLHAPAYRPLREMFLFRPYDKATIWEQHMVTRLSAQLRTDVLLWECMALTPAFVQLLQKRWMRDDIATITNTFPDHEDIQGPAGIDIPQVMAHFIPDNKLLLTSEEHMRPILAEAAQTAGTQLVGVGWLESGLITPDILARFPYQEHPDNIALVLALARSLGVAEDFALKEMADRVVPDLGVLKVYPEAEVDGRRLSFANGMSANERFGCLSNWRRLAFDRCAADEQPATLVSTVVNNRADRVARSRVFAAIVAEDIEADHHFLIGSNLEGLQGYIAEAWQAHIANLTLTPATGETPATVLADQARRLRQPTTAERIIARLSAMIGERQERQAAIDSWREPTTVAELLAAAHHPHAEVIVKYLQADITAHDEYHAFLNRLRDTPISSELDEEFRLLLTRWFERKLVVIEDYHASGNQVIKTVAQHTPPGCLNRVMGIQNIKGTGLDFVYRWQAWETCHRACQQLASHERSVFREGLATLVTFREFGVLTDVALRMTIETAHASPLAQNEQTRVELNILQARMNLAMRVLYEELGTVHSHSKLESAILAVEGFIDAGDALWRRKRANRIYADLAAMRIGVDRAVKELMELTQRQKGGWLYRSLADWWRRIVRRND